MATMVEVIGARQHTRAQEGVCAVGEHENVAKNILLFFAAPFIGLAYIVVLPLVGVGALVRMAARGL